MLFAPNRLKFISFTMSAIDGDFNLEFGDTSLREAIKASIKDSSHLAADPKADSKKGKDGKDARVSKDKSGTCTLCDEPKHNSSFCRAHKRAYETIYRAAMAEGARKKPSEDAEWDEGLECWKLCEHWIFITIFGDEKERKMQAFRMPSEAHQMLVQFVIDNPEGKEKRKVRRTAVNLCAFWHNQICRQSSEEVGGLKKVDEEAFVFLMKGIRGWDLSKATVKWNFFKNDPDIKRDNDGPAWSKFRLHLPKAIFAEDSTEERKGVVEEKTLQRSSKAAKLTAEEQAELLAETQRGFKRPFSNVDAVETMHSALGPNAHSAEGADEKTVTTSSSMSLLRASVDKLKDAETPAKSKANSGEPPAKQPKTDAMAASPTDVKDARSSAHRLQVAELAKCKTKLLDVLKDAAVAIEVGDVKQDTDLITTLDERIVIGAVCVKKFFQTSKDDKTGKTVATALDCSFSFDTAQLETKFKFSYTSLAGTVTEAAVVREVASLASIELTEGFTVQAMQHQAALKAALAQVKMLPIEAPDELMSWTQLEENCLKIKEVDSALALEDLSSVFERQKTLQEQLRTAIKTPTTSLRRVVNAREQAVKKKEAADKALEEKKKQEAIALKILDAKAEKQYLEARKQFSVNFINAGHAEGKVVVGDDDAKKAKEASDTSKRFDKPFKLASTCVAVKELLENASMSSMLTSWLSTINKPAKDASQQKVEAMTTMQHALSIAQGQPLVRGLCDKYFDTIAVPEDLKETADKVHLFGYKETYIRHWCEPDALGSFRIITSGQLIVYAVNGSEMEAAAKTNQWLVGCGNVGFDPEVKDRILPPFQRAVGIMKVMTDEIAQKLHSTRPSCHIHSFIVGPGEALYVPPGYLVSAACANNASVAGLRCAMLVNCDPSALGFIKDSSDKTLSATAAKLLDSITLAQLG